VVAGATERLRLVTSVLVLPYRNPVLTAKMAASLDVLSGGRLTLGVGAGWLKEEFEALNSPAFNARGAVTDEWITIFNSSNSGPKPAGPVLRSNPGVIERRLVRDRQRREVAPLGLGQLLQRV
jgi:alkanesulfonate monooxygenase SsuD/methylene tetrahydromethanopterin reductase-like flavin-dependent oxidoreductase (luciferase family)